MRKRPTRVVVDPWLEKLIGEPPTCQEVLERLNRQVEVDFGLRRPGSEEGVPKRADASAELEEESVDESGLAISLSMGQTEDDGGQEPG